MVPTSVGQMSSPGTGRANLQSSFAPGRPRNMTTAKRAELFALVTWLSAFVVAAVGIAFGDVWLRLKVVDLGYRLSATRQVIQKLENEQRDLVGRLAALEAPNRIEEAARRLGMMHPEKGREAALP